MKTALQFSGGKDSLALLWYMQPFWPLIDVVFLDTGDMYPSTTERVRSISHLLPHFTWLHSDAPKYRKQHGDPTDANWLKCCIDNVYAPMHRYIREKGYRQVLRGTKAIDPHVHVVFPGDVLDNILFTFPLWHWTDLDVEQYLGLRLPTEYRLGAVGMPDCKTCTAVGMCGGTTKGIWDSQLEVSNEQAQAGH